MVLHDWLSSFRFTLTRKVRRSRLKKFKRLQRKSSSTSSRTEILEARTLLTAPELVSITPNVGSQLVSGQTYKEAPNQFTIKFSPNQTIDPTTLSGITLVRAGGDGVFGQSNDVTIPSYVGIGDQPNEVVLRLSSSLPGDVYRITIPGAGANAVKNTNGEAFNSGVNVSLNFQLDIGSQILSVVPQPVMRLADGSLTQRTDRVEVYFNEDMNVTTVTNPAYYQLVNTNTKVPMIPASVTYDATLRKATLIFSAGLPYATYQLKIGVDGQARNTLTTAIDAGAIYKGTNYYAQGNLGNQNGLNDVDLYKIQLPASGNGFITVTPKSPTLNTVIRLFDQNGVQVAISNNGSINVPDTLTFSNNHQATYYIGISSAGNTAYNPITGAGATGGTSSGAYQLAVSTSVVFFVNDDNSSFDTATNISNLSSPQSITSQIETQNFIQLLPPPGSSDEPGARDTAYGLENASSSPAPITLPGSSVSNTGIPTQSYYFGDVYGTDPQGNPLHNAITPQQKQRAREIFDLIGYYSGIQFVETSGSGIQVVTGDPRAIAPNLGGPVGGIAGGGKAIVNANFDYGDSEYGGGWFGIAMHEILHNLGMIHDFDQIAIMGSGTMAGDDPNAPGTDTASGNGLGVEGVYPMDPDILYLNRLHPKDGTDIDLYKFNLTQAGTVSAEITAERMASSSSLNSVLTLYQETKDAKGNLVRTVIAQNDDYFGNDSFLNLELQSGTYYIGVSSTGNDNYNPIQSNTGGGGRTQGAYNLKLNFQADPAPSITDAAGTALDGDNDGQAGGTFNYWFQTGNTIFVDKNSTASGPEDGTLAHPFRNISSQPNASQIGALNYIQNNPGKVVNLRIVSGYGDTKDSTSGLANNPYLIGRNSANNALSDGATFNIPKGVNVVIGPGSILKFNQTVLNVGSFTVNDDRSGGTLQVIGTPQSNVQLTSYNNDSIGGNSNGTGPNVNAGDWGGIVFRADSDKAAGSGVYMNSVVGAQLTYGGGKVSINSEVNTYAPIHLVGSRPALFNNTITNSADAAISADPNSFLETTDRVGPAIHGNVIKSNSINGLFVRIRTDQGSPIDTLDVPARFDDTDIVYVIAENLLINGNPAGAGGPTDPSGSTPRIAGRLMIDPGAIVKLGGSRIETTVGGSQLIAEGTAEHPIIFTSLADDSYGAGGSFDSTNDGTGTPPAPGQWGGLAFGPVSSASLDHVVVTYAGGSTPIAGGFDEYNPVEIHQATARITNSTFVNNSDGASTGFRNGFGKNTPAVIYVQGAQPVIVNNTIINNANSTSANPAYALSINTNALNNTYVSDPGRSTGLANRFTQIAGNTGPLIRLNKLEGNGFNGMLVRAEVVNTGTIWDDTDIVHIVTNQITVPNFHSNGGLRLQSSDTESLVVKFKGQDAGFVASGTPLDIQDRIGGSVQILGRPNHSVILTSIADDTVGAGFTPNGVPQTDTNSDGSKTVPGGISNPGPEVDNGTLIDNDLPTAAFGHYEAQPGPGGQFSIFDNPQTNNIRMTVHGQTQDFINANSIYEYINSIDVGTDGGGIDLNDTTITMQPTLIAPDVVASEGTFQGANGLIKWHVENWFVNGEQKLRTKVVLTAVSGSLGTMRYVSTVHDHGAFTSGDDIITTTGTPGQDDFETLNLDNAERIGFGHGGSFTAAGGLVGATYAGWNADFYADLDSAVTGPGAKFDVNGVIDTTDLPSQTDPTLGQIYGPGHPGTALAWDVDANATTATITNYLELHPLERPRSDWNGITLDQDSNDTNVGIVTEQEPALTHGVDRNGQVAFAQYMGILAPNEAGGNADRRLGFEVHGIISPDAPNDVDTYSFTGTAGSEIWVDLDRTNTSLDSVVELVDSTNTWIVRSSDINNQAAVNSGVTPINGLTKSNADGGDFFGSNSLDGGFRVTLPGAIGTTNTYFVRVRSQPKAATPGSVLGGLTSGDYQLQVRLRQKDEVPGSTVQYADVRYSSNGITLKGVPYHSPLTGETSEAENLPFSPAVSNNPPTTVGDAATPQNLGNLLTTDQAVLSVAGNLSAAGDVDVYKFTLGYDLLETIKGVNNADKSFATMFDIDYADGISRPDTTLALFDENGTLIYVGRSSNISDDQPAAGQGNDLDDLSRGSVGPLDPYLGSVQLPAGSSAAASKTYYIAVSSNATLPTTLKATFDGTVASSTRLEPINSVQRIVEDHIGGSGAQGYTSGNDDVGKQKINPTTGPILDISNAQALSTEVKPFTLADVNTWVTNKDHLYTINPFTGQKVTDVGQVVGTDGIQDLAMRSDGRMFTYSNVTSVSNNSPSMAGTLDSIDPATGTLTTVGDDNIDDNILVSDSVGALAYNRIAAPDNYALYYAVNNSTTSELAKADPLSGASNDSSQGSTFTVKGAIIDPTFLGTFGHTTGMAFRNNVLYGVSETGLFFQINQGTGQASVIKNFGQSIPFSALSLGPQNVQNGAFANLFFALTSDGRMMCFDVNGAVQGVFAGGNSTISLPPELATGATGLAFTPADYNLWHPTMTRGNDAGHGILPTADNTRSPGLNDYNIQGRSANESKGDASFYFGLEQYQQNPDSARTYFRYGNVNAQYGVLDSQDFQDLASGADLVSGAPTGIGTSTKNVTGNYNVPGGALGSLITKSFSLSGYSRTDKPTLYFNYFLDTQNDPTGTASNAMRDSARVFASTDGGLTWTLVATNNSQPDAELPPTPTVNSNDSFKANQGVQELFDNTGAWRQARVDLGQFAGKSNVQLRFDFSTAGSMSNNNALTGDQYGNFSSPTRAVDNDHQGFFVDDIIVGFAERGEAVTGATANDATYFTVPQNATYPAQALTGSYQLEIRGGAQYAIQTDLSKSALVINSQPDTNAHLSGDSNVQRRQGEIIIANNTVSNTDGAGISIIPGDRDLSSDGSETDLSHPGAPRNLPVLNGDRLIESALIANNLLYDNKIGISVSGDSNAATENVTGVPYANVPYAKIVNNTIFGSDVPAGIGIQALNNASPTILNNIIANTQTAISLTALTSANPNLPQDKTVSSTVIGTTVFKGNLSNGPTGSNAIILPNSSDPLFVDSAARNFYLQDNSLAIDSSLNSSPDRPSQAAVKNAIGIPVSPVFAPDNDRFGITRVDDPSQAPPPGLGQNIFKDRGAIERTDFLGLKAVLASPLDNGTSDYDPATATVLINNQPLTQILVDLVDLANNGLGSGVDDSKVTKDKFAITRNGVTLVEGTDYTFEYNAATNRITFTLLSSLNTDVTYVVKAVNNNAITDLAGNSLQANQSDGTTSFKIITLNGVNDPPVNTVPGPQSVNEDTLLKFSTATNNGISIADSDAIFGTNQVKVSLSVQNGIMTLGSFTGLTYQTGDGVADKTITFTGTLANVNKALNGLLYLPNTNFFGTDTLTIVSNDLGNFNIPASPAKTDTDTVNINVTSVNDSPVINAAGKYKLDSIKEEETANAGTLVSAMIASAGGDPITDVDTGAVEGIAIHGINTTDGTWQYSLNNGTTWSTMTGISATSALLLNSDAQTRVRFVPNELYNGTFTAIAFTAWDRTQGINGGRLSLASRGGSSSLASGNAFATLTVTPNPHNISITNLGGKVNFIEKGSPVLLSTTAVVNDSAAPVFGGGNLTVKYTANGTAADVIKINNEGSGANQISVNAGGNTVSYGGTAFGIISGGVGTNPLVVTFNASANNTNVQALIRNLTYSNTSANPSTLTRTVQLKLKDVGGDTSLPVYKDLGVIPVNDPPVLLADTSTALNYVIGLSSVAVLPAATVTDADNTLLANGKITVSITQVTETTDTLSIRSTGSGDGQVNVFGSDVFFSGQKVGSFTGGTQLSPFVVTFNATATPAAAQEIVRNITFRTSSTNGNRAVTFVLNDGSGGNSSAVTRTISVFGSSFQAPSGLVVTNDSAATITGSSLASTPNVPQAPDAAMITATKETKTPKARHKMKSVPTAEIDSLFSAFSLTNLDNHLS